MSGYAGTCKTPKNPKEKFVLAPEPVSYTRKSPTNRIEEVLSNRKTINVFRAWNHHRYDRKNYGLRWSGAFEPVTENSIFINEIFWAYARLGRSSWNGKPIKNIEKFLLNRNWGDSKYYGKSLVTNLKNPEFKNQLLQIITNYNANRDGILFDYWHNRHKGMSGYSEQDVKNFRIELSKKIRSDLGNDFIIIGNINWDKDTGTHDYINGVFMELYKKNRATDGYSCSQINKMDELLKFHDQNLQEPRIVAFNPWRITKKLSREKVQELLKKKIDKKEFKFREENLRKNYRSSDENIKFAKLFTAMAMVIPENGYILYGDNHPDNPNGDHFHDFYDFYNTDLGKETSIGMEITEGVGFKMYEKGVIVYNYTKERYKIKFTNQKEVTIDPLEGMFVEF